MSYSISIGKAGGTFGDLEQAIRAWVVAAVATQGVAAERVYFAAQELPDDPASARVTIAIDGPFSVGVDGHTHSFDAGADPGEEIGLTASGNRELVVRLQAFAPATVGAGVTARSLLAACRVMLEAESIAFALRAAGLGVLVAGDVLRLPAVVSSRHEDRATLDSRFSVRQEVTERTGYFDKVMIDGTVSPQ